MTLSTTDNKIRFHKHNVLFKGHLIAKIFVKKTLHLKVEERL